MTTVRQAASVSLVLWLCGSILDLAADEACEGWISEGEILQEDFFFFCPLVFFQWLSGKSQLCLSHGGKFRDTHTEISSSFGTLRERSDLQFFSKKKKRKRGSHSGRPCQTPDAAVTPCGYNLDHIIQFNTALLSLTEKYQH